PADPSGFVFDVRSGAVRAQGGCSENMKEKVQAVRAVVPNCSNTDIVLVLQHFDNSVDRTVQAFMEGNASEVLKEWTVTRKKKNKKKKPKPKSQPGSNPLGKSNPGEEENLEKLEKLGISLNGFHGNNSESLESLSEGPEPGAGLGKSGNSGKSGIGDGIWGIFWDFPEGILELSCVFVRRSSQIFLEFLEFQTGILAFPAALGNRIPNFPAQSQSLIPSRSLQSSPGFPGGKKLGSGLEKSLKDLQRCSVALARFRALLREELESSLRRVRLAFGEIQSCLMDREVALLAEMDKVKAEAMELLALRQRRAEALWELTEAAPGMSEEQLLELRADIKHFVSERKFDEELGRAGRFGCDLDALRGSIGAFGQVSHPRPSYSSRSRCSSGPAILAGSALGPSGSAPGSAPA
ncbi:SPAS2 protein, partial [Erythrocercus mccallii]|nr:SPAS2 protein [Erythrocercus mccallii]